MISSKCAATACEQVIWLLMYFNHQPDSKFTIKFQYTAVKRPLTPEIGV